MDYSENLWLTLNITNTMEKYIYWLRLLKKIYKRQNHLQILEKDL